MSTALGIRLNIQSTTDGVGFVNPQPLPDFPSGIQALHLFRRSAVFSSYNRVTQLAETLSSTGMEFRADEVYGANASQRLLYKGPSVDLTNFTIAVAARVNKPDDDDTNRTTIIASSDWTQDGVGPDQGFRINTQSSGFYDVSISSRIYMDGEMWLGGRPYDIPDPHHPVIIFYSFDGTNAVLSIPGLSQVEIISPQPRENAVDPSPNPSWVFGDAYPDPNGAAEHETKLGLSAFAQWSRALDTSEIEAAHEAMKEWAAAFDLELV